MREIIEFSPDEIKPDPAAVFRAQGIPAEADIREKVHEQLNQALDLFGEMADPVGIITDISIDDFAAVYPGDGRNIEPAPVQEIFPRADYLALFAATVGGELSSEIARLFDEGEFALGALLDTAASEGVETCGHGLVRHYARYLRTFDNLSTLEKAIQRYSPGYCGWDMSGQKALFEYLEPEEIGIELNQSFLMIPLKSISGVMIAGDREIHEFRPTYSFCAQCQDKGCLKRMISKYWD